MGAGRARARTAGRGPRGRQWWGAGTRLARRAASRPASRRGPACGSVAGCRLPCMGTLPPARTPPSPPHPSDVPIPCETAAPLRPRPSYIESLVAAEAAEGVPSERVVVAGFSQGGAVALMMLRSEHKLAGVVGARAGAESGAGRRAGAGGGAAWRGRAAACSSCLMRTAGRRRHPVLLAAEPARAMPRPLAPRPPQA